MSIGSARSGENKQTDLLLLLNLYLKLKCRFFCKLSWNTWPSLEAEGAFLSHSSQSQIRRSYLFPASYIWIKRGAKINHGPRVCVRERDFAHVSMKRGKRARCLVLTHEHRLKAKLMLWSYRKKKKKRGSINCQKEDHSNIHYLFTHSDPSYLWVLCYLTQNDGIHKSWERTKQEMGAFSFLLL